jgi:hypothetical protein
MNIICTYRQKLSKVCPGFTSTFFSLTSNSEIEFCKISSVSEVSYGRDLTYNHLITLSVSLFHKKTVAQAKEKCFPALSLLALSLLLDL